MWRISYIDENGKISQKGGFNNDKEAIGWAENTKDITALKLLVWSEQLQCFRIVEEF